MFEPSAPPEDLLFGNYNDDAPHVYPDLPPEYQSNSSNLFNQPSTRNTWWTQSSQTPDTYHPLSFYTIVPHTDLQICTSLATHIEREKSKTIFNWISSLWSTSERPRELNSPDSRRALTSRVIERSRCLTFICECDIVTENRSIISVSEPYRGGKEDKSLIYLESLDGTLHKHPVNLNVARRSLNMWSFSNNLNVKFKNDFRDDHFGVHWTSEDASHPIWGFTKGITQEELAETSKTRDCTDCPKSLGYLPCKKCLSKGKVICTKCSGQGKTNGGDSNTIPCHNCNGTGKLKCKVCDGMGRIRCETCDASGVVRDFLALKIVRSAVRRIQFVAACPSQSSDSDMEQIKYANLDDFLEYDPTTSGVLPEFLRQITDDLHSNVLVEDVWVAGDLNIAVDCSTLAKRQSGPLFPRIQSDQPTLVSKFESNQIAQRTFPMNLVNSAISNVMNVVDIVSRTPLISEKTSTVILSRRARIIQIGHTAQVKMIDQSTREFNLLLEVNDQLPGQESEIQIYKIWGFERSWWDSIWAWFGSS
ncbi:hypothetical protein HK096_008792 [Nowakowskiella sp. JEL0078]|nr:hypothetical protein HK096_008792 [Nowakowskiella sp. JEL0078]